MTENTPTPVPVENEDTGNPTVSSSEKTNAMIIHLSGLSNLIIPLGNIILPIILWQVMKKDSEFCDDQGKEAVNFNLSYLLYNILLLIVSGGSVITALIGAGKENVPAILASSSGLIISLLILSVLFIIKFIFIIIAAVRSNSGDRYRYPLIIRFIK